MPRTLIASDWHLGHFSAPAAARLALCFLERARRAGDAVVLNGDIFEGLFEPQVHAQSAHPEVCALIAAMTAAGQVRRTEGNHDPGAGVPSIILDHPTLGRVLVAHGHAVDPMQGSAVLNVGDGISRRFGKFAVVRGAAWLADATARRVAGPSIERVFRTLCTAAVERERCAFGVFGHVHRQFLGAGQRYANAGHLRRTRLEFLALTETGAELGRLELADALARRPDAPDSYALLEESACSTG
ncbi:MAG TPA: metallophosphoesterase [Gemmatimonadaceae bacterium]|nr:metallophosphoesterase [Gemmatimonadaceae bacterium]